jgi:putative tricarboxylic transport membrane protein
MKKRIVSALILILSLTLLAGCSGSKEPAKTGAFKFERKIEIVIPFGPGSGTDTTIRAWAPLMEKELGVPISINNVEGASGVKGAEFFFKQPADGYTFAMYTPSHLIAAVNKTTNFDILNETVPVVRLVQDANVILAGKKVPYNNMKELIAYAKANPGKAKIGLMSVAGIDAVSVKQLFDAAGIEVPMVPYGSGAEANAAVIGGHIDMVLTSPFDANSYLESGDMKGIVILSEKRASTLPNVESTGELKIDAYIGPWRGIVTRKGAPEEAIKAFEAAAIKVNSLPEWTEWKKKVSLNDREGYANRADFTKIWSEYYETMKQILKK